jgi:hypothetical protein
MLGSRVARLFFVQQAQNGKNIPNDYKMYKIITTIANGLEIY